MTIHYLEIVTPEVDTVREAYAVARDVTFDLGEPALGGACLAELDGAEVAVAEVPLPGHGTCAIVLCGGVEMGF